MKLVSPGVRCLPQPDTTTQQNVLSLCAYDCFWWSTTGQGVAQMRMLFTDHTRAQAHTKLTVVLYPAIFFIFTFLVESAPRRRISLGCLGQIKGEFKQHESVRLQCWSFSWSCTKLRPWFGVIAPSRSMNKRNKPALPNAFFGA